MAKASKKKIATALRAAMGNISAAARALGMARSYISGIVNADPGLLQVAIDARETLVDNAESALGRAVLQGEGWAVCFTLKTQGKSRGYVERQEVHSESKVTIAASAEELTDDQLAAIAIRSGGAPASAETGQKEPD
jgi:hypothetical protein